MRSLYLFAIAVGLSGLSAVAHAQPARTFVATTGSDGNPCSAAAPCRTLGEAITAVADDGDVIILDSGGFGENITITKSVSVLAPAGIVARLRTSGSGYGVSINGTGIRVTIDGVGITGIGNSSTKGVYFQAGAALVLRNMDINVFGGRNVVHNAVGGKLTMENGFLRNGGRCFYAESTVGFITAAIVNVHASNCDFSFYVGGLSSVSIQRSSATGRGKINGESYACFVALGNGNGTAYLIVDDVMASACYYGVAAGPLNTGGPGSISVSNAVITNTTEPIRVFTTSTCVTFGNNKLFNNNSNTVGGCTVTPGQ